MNGYAFLNTFARILMFAIVPTSVFAQRIVIPDQPLVKEDVKDMTLSVAVDTKTMPLTIKTGNISLIVTIKNISKASVTYMKWPPSKGIVIYMCDTDGDRMEHLKAVFPFDPVETGLNHVFPKTVAPGNSVSYSISVPLAILNIKNKTFVASVIEHVNGDARYRNEVFSEPFALPNIR